LYVTENIDIHLSVTPIGMLHIKIIHDLLQQMIVKYNKLSTATNNEAKEITILSVIPPLDFPLSFSTHYCVPWSHSPAHGNFTMESTRLWHLAPTILFYFAIYYHLLYWFLRSVYPGSARGIFTMQQHWATTSLSYCFVLDYLFVNQILFFPSFHFAHVSVLLCLAITQVRIPFIMERLFLSLAALPW